jgi:TPR repeat protein
MKTNQLLWMLLTPALIAVQSYGQQSEEDRKIFAERKAKAEKGDARFQCALGEIYDLGLYGITRDIVEAVKWYRKAADQDFPEAQYDLGSCYSKGEGVPKDKVEAVRWYGKAAGQNLAKAQYNLGVCYRDGEGVAKDETEALGWFRRAAEQNLAVAQYNLGVCYATGAGVAKDEVEGYKWFLLAAAQGDDSAKKNVAVSENRLTAQRRDFSPRKLGRG